MPRVTQTLSESYEAEAAAVGRARRELANFAVAAGASAPQVDSVRLAVSEAVTNAVLHGYRGAPGTVQITAGVAAGELWILVSDSGGGMQPVTDRPGLGLGLGLIAQISNHMTIVPSPEGGTELRMRFDLSGEALAVAPSVGDVAVSVVSVGSPTRG